MKVRELFQALGDPLRYRIVEALRISPQCVTDLVASLGVSQPNVSRHLKILRESGLIRSTRDGKWIRYSIDPEAVGLIRLWSGMSGGAVPENAESPFRVTSSAGPDERILFTDEK